MIRNTYNPLISLEEEASCIYIFLKHKSCTPYIIKIHVVSKKKHLFIFTLTCLLFTNIDYPFGIFKLFLQINGNYYLKIVHFLLQYCDKQEIVPLQEKVCDV